jgi:hypothetical protein
MKFLAGLLLGLNLFGTVDKGHEIITYPTIYSEAIAPTRIEDELYNPIKDKRLNYTSE